MAKSYLIFINYSLFIHSYLSKSHKKSLVSKLDLALNSVQIKVKTPSLFNLFYNTFTHFAEHQPLAFKCNFLITGTLSTETHPFKCYFESDNSYRPKDLLHLYNTLRQLY